MSNLKRNSLENFFCPTVMSYLYFPCLTLTTFVEIKVKTSYSWLSMDKVVWTNIDVKQLKFALCKKKENYRGFLSNEGMTTTILYINFFCSTYVWHQIQILSILWNSLSVYGNFNCQHWLFQLLMLLNYLLNGAKCFQKQWRRLAMIFSIVILVIKSNP